MKLEVFLTRNVKKPHTVLTEETLDTIGHALERSPRKLI